MKLEPPKGFRAYGETARLIATPERIDALVDAGFDRAEAWVECLRAGGRRRGRGNTGRFEFADGATLHLKQLRRGGLLEPLWRDRFVGSRRLIANLTIPIEAATREIATPSPVAMLVVPGPAGLRRAWIAFEELLGAVDAASAFLSQAPPTRDEQASMMGLVRRMHDAGLEHRDLNLGNLMLRRSGGTSDVFVIDLDRACLHDGALRFHLRQRGLRRLERSYVKETGSKTGADWIYDGYGADDPEWSGRLSRRRHSGV